MLSHDRSPKGVHPGQGLGCRRNRKVLPAGAGGGERRRGFGRGAGPRRWGASPRPLRPAVPRGEGRPAASVSCGWWVPSRTRNRPSWEGLSRDDTANAPAVSPAQALSPPSREAPLPQASGPGTHAARPWPVGPPRQRPSAQARGVRCWYACREGRAGRRCHPPCPPSPRRCGKGPEAPVGRGGPGRRRWQAVVCPALSRGFESSRQGRPEGGRGLSLSGWSGAWGTF